MLESQPRRSQLPTTRLARCRLTAVAALVACLLLPVHAGAQEEEGATPLSTTLDVLVLRPLGLLGTAIGVGLFVPAAVLSCGGGLDNTREAWEIFVSTPAERVFGQPLGEI